MPGFVRETQVDFARNGVPFELILAKDLHRLPAEIRALSNREYLELLAMYRLNAERANRRR